MDFSVTYERDWGVGWIAARPAVGTVLGPGQVPPGIDPGIVRSRDGNAARYAVVLSVDPLGHEAIDAIGGLRRDLPGLLREAGLPGARASIAGDTALARETITMMTGDLWRVAIAVIVLELVVLAVFLRSLRAPFYLVAASVLALAATVSGEAR